jgi:hypothetical protein
LEPAYPATNQTSNKGGCGSWITLIMAWFWITSVAFGRISVSMVATYFRYQLPDWTPFALAVGQGLFLISPLLLLATLWPVRRFAGIFRTWAAAAALVLLLALLHLTRPHLAQLQAVLHILLAGLYILLLVILFQRRSKQTPEATPASPGLSSQPAILSAALIAAVFAYPWLAWGALGSPLDTLLQALAALSLGLAAAVTVEAFLLPGLRESETPDAGYPGGVVGFLLSGLAAGVTLLIIASATGFGFSGMQLVLMLSLPAMGWAMVWLGRSSQARFPASSLPMGLLAGAGLAAPMILIDPSELHILTSAYPGEIFQWALTAAGVSFLTGVGLAIVLFVVIIRARRRDSELAFRKTKFSLVLAAWLIGGAIYLGAGQPGFHGESLFVILKDQASLPAYTPGEDYFAHRQLIYTTLVQHAEDSQAGLSQQFERLSLRYTPYYLINGLEVQGGPLLRLWLSSRAEVDRVLLNPWMRPLTASPPANTGDQPAPEGIPWNLQLIQAERVWNELGVTGTGIVIGQSDSGVQWDHPELLASYRGQIDQSEQHDYNWLDPWYGTPAPVDPGGHGTHTLSTITGSSTGVAPSATWYACANLVRIFGNPALYLDCMQFMLAPYPTGGDPFRDGNSSLGAHVTNNSWGCPDIEGCDPDALLPAAQALRAAGIFVAVSAGNDGPTCQTINAPLAIYGEVFSVGAISPAGELADFSSRGPVTVDGSGRVKPDILAPGVDVLSAYPGSTYQINMGTSMAGPHVAGVVALIWSANPDLIGDIQRTEQILIQSAQPYTGRVPVCPGAQDLPSTASGYGVLDAYRAVQLAMDEMAQ